MGAVAAVMGSGLTCVGSCAGSCLAAGCCKLATGGETDNKWAARCVLLWLQVLAAVTGVLLAVSNPDSWLKWPCDHLDTVGICACHQLKSDKQGDCYGDQFVNRAEASVLLVYAFLLILCVSGCAKQAAKYFPAGKFVAMLVIMFALLFIPNEVADVFGQTAGIASSIYLVAQTVLLVDFAYTWNENWHHRALEAHRREVGSRGYRLWLAAILISSGLLLVAGLVGCVSLSVQYTTAGAHTLVIVAFLASLVLLLLSITDWCEHGALLTSSLVTAYTMWLCYEALAMLPATSEFTPPAPLPRWVGLAICAVSLTAFAFSAGMAGAREQGGRNQALVAVEEGAGASATASTTSEAGESGESSSGGLDNVDFTVQCLVHTVAAFYVASSLAPTKGWITLGCRIAAVALSLVLYGWSLVAPKVLTNRSFS